MRKRQAFPRRGAPAFFIKARPAGAVGGLLRRYGGGERQTGCRRLSAAKPRRIIGRFAGRRPAKRFFPFQAKGWPAGQAGRRRADKGLRRCFFSAIKGVISAKCVNAGRRPGLWLYDRPEVPI